MFKRSLQKELKEYAKFPVVAIIGPRQSGKTTLARATFRKHTYVSFENPLTREFAENDPERFLQTHENEHGIIIDEFQHIPKFLSYIQLDVDNKRRKGYFILTGSQNFLMNEAITQSLAGRVGIVTLLPLSLAELTQNKLLPHDSTEAIFNGSYPRLYQEEMSPEKFYPAYIHTYVERDARQLVNIGDLSTFQKFIGLCAARIGNILNLSELATVCNISNTTAQRWISILQASYIIFLLEPHYENFNKRLTKMPKLYFYDTGLACSLLRIPSAKQLPMSPSWGGLFENFIIADLAKQYYTIGSRPPIYFWRDNNGRIEIDCLIDDAGKLFPIEIKASLGISAHFFKGLEQWVELVQKTKPSKDSGTRFLIYAGNETQVRTFSTVIPWTESGKLVAKIRKLITPPSRKVKTKTKRKLVVKMAKKTIVRKKARP